METTPCRPGEAAPGLEPLSSSILSPAHVASPSTPHLHPRALDQGQHQGREGKLRERKARGIRGQREFPQKNRDTGLSGEPKVTFTGLWVIEAVSLAELPVMAMSPDRTNDRNQKGFASVANFGETAALRVLPSDCELSSTRPFVTNRYS